MKVKLNKFKCLYNYGTSPKKWDTKLGGTHKHDGLSAYCFWSFFHNADVCLFAKTTALILIIYSYKTNPSFLPSPWNLRSIGPSDF